MKEEGIIDPTKVARCALENASSVASMILTTESIVTDVMEKRCCCNLKEGQNEVGEMY